MLERLGNVLYWLGCGVAALLLILGAVEFVAMEGPNHWRDGAGIFVLCAVAAFIALFFGRASRYFLAGK